MVAHRDRSTPIAHRRSQPHRGSKKEEDMFRCAASVILLPISTPKPEFVTNYLLLEPQLAPPRLPPRMIYLDNSATTRLDERVRDAMLPYFGDDFGNASSIYDLGRHARIALEEARTTIASVIGAEESEIIFTSSGTEANNHAIKGAIFHARSQGRRFEELSVITSSAEHHAVLEPCEFLSAFGVAISKVAVSDRCQVNAEELASQLSGDTTLVSIMSVNNEIGSINPVGEVARLTKKIAPHALVHTDAVQALGKIPIDVKDWNVDLLTLSAHKVHGPKGIGALFIRRGIMIEPLLHGGAQERNRRGSTENVALAVGFAKAAEIMRDEWKERMSHLSELKHYLMRELKSMPEIVLNTPDEDSVSSIINFTFHDKLLPKLDGEALLIRFDLEGIAVSNGSACTSGSLQPSHVLLAMGKGEAVASKSIRVSLSKDTKAGELDAFLIVLKKLTAEFV
jgi:cysteine desulfurase